ncbi:O-antigen polymerase [Cyanobacterium aponinum AL20118]|uniref:O-antigen polymerase n=2 Tax=Cyanobacterium TaxID=102234 RepID=A0AAF1C3L3_9CHRO|nr:O-antigen polymerase [Cyanobacterium aponinum]WPF89978.1 O-antigen polymerase [Cyanobacterium aponinum AL20115]
MIFAYIMTVFSSILTYLGIVCGYSIKNKSLFLIFNKIIGITVFKIKKISDIKNIFTIGLFFIGFGICVYIYFLMRMGGLVDLWLNLNQRVERAAGLGYFQSFYSFAISMGSLICLYVTFSKNKYFTSILIFLLNSFVLLSLGQRGPLLSFIISVMILRHYGIERFRKLFTLKRLFLIILMIIISLISVQFRQINAVEKYSGNVGLLMTDAFESFETHLLLRFSRVERDVVILKYFDENDFWLGSSYLSLVTAPIPRNIFPDKPPVDTGRYLLGMAEGRIINPPMPVSELPPSSWPEANWAGYMNFGILGFILLFFISGVIPAWIYNFMKFHSFSIGSILLYTEFCRVSVLSPSGIVGILTNLILFFILSFAYKLYLFMIRKNKKGRNSITFENQL